MEFFGYSIWTILFVCLGVFCASFMDAIGGGGGIISLPTYLLAGLPMHVALGTNKLSACIGTVASTVRYVKNGCVDWVLGGPSIVLALVGAHLGTRLQLMVDERYLKYLLLIVLPADQANDLLRDILNMGVPAAIVGEMMEPDKKEIYVTTTKK